MRRRDLFGYGAGVLLTPSMSFASSDETWDESVDVLVAGGGAAGLCAALTASDSGASVLVAEKMPRIGGDTLISGGYFNAVDPKRQQAQGIEDSEELFVQQILTAGAGRNSLEFARTLAHESTITLEWLEGLGLQFLPTVQEVFGSVYPRSHKPVLARGTGYVKVLSEAALRRKVRILTSSPVHNFILNGSGRVVGARLQTKRGIVRVEARRGVIVASGGFGASKAMRLKYTPQVADLPSDSHPGATGELLEAAESVGAALVNMGFAECVPGAAAAFNYPIRLDYVPSRVIIVNSRGRRFVDETKGRRAIAEAVLREMKEGPCFSVASSRALELFDPISLKNLYRGLFAGQAWKADTPEELAEKVGLPIDALVEEMRASAKSRAMDQAPFWATKLFLRVHHTLGGIRIDTEARVLNRQGEVIPGFFAAGETTGSVHGAERIGGNGLPSACAFGRIAGFSVMKT